MRYSLISCIALAMLSAPVLGQELVQNGDFSNQLNGWTGSGPGQLIGTNGLTSYDVNAQGASPCFGMRPGGNSYSPPHAPYKLSTSITPLIPGLYYEVNIDIAVVSTGNNAQGPIIEIWLAGTKVADWTRFVSGIKVGNFKDRLCGRFKYSGPAGKQTLEVHLARPKYIWSTRTPVCYIDNVSMRRATNPVLCWVGERKIGTNMTMAVHGEAAAAVAVFIAAKNITPIQIPGIGGALQLDPTSFTFLLSGQLDKSGTLSLTVPIPSISALAGKPIWWQGLHVDNNGPTFGGAYNVAVYN